MDTTTRASMMRRLLVLVGGAVGVGAAGVATPRLVDEQPKPARARETLTLYARDLRAQPIRGEGATAVNRATLARRAELLDAKRQSIGRFSGVPLAGGESQLHTFTLAGGTLFGMASGLGGAVHAIVGGTGRYAGATGTYMARPAPALPGRSAELTITFEAWEA